MAYVILAIIVIYAFAGLIHLAGKLPDFASDRAEAIRYRLKYESDSPVRLRLKAELYLCSFVSLICMVVGVVIIAFFLTGWLFGSGDYDDQYFDYEQYIEDEEYIPCCPYCGEGIHTCPNCGEEIVPLSGPEDQYEPREFY